MGGLLEFGGIGYALDTCDTSFFLNFRADLFIEGIKEV